MTGTEDSERAIIAQIIQSPEWTLRHASRITPKLFSRVENQLIFEAACEAGDKWDLLKLTAILRKRGHLERAGGPGLISELAGEFLVPSAMDWHLDHLRAATALKNAKEAALAGIARIDTALTMGAQDAPEILAEIQASLEAAGKLPGKRLKKQSMAEATERLLDSIEERAKAPGAIPGLTTGFEKLDGATLGLQPGHVWIFCGGPGDGKSTLMQNCAEGALFAGAKLGIYQLEMPIEEQAFRFLTSAAEVDNGNLWLGQITNAEKDAVRQAVKKLKKHGAELMVTDDVSASDILADIEAADYDVVMVDYLQLMDEKQGKNETREMVIARISRRLKQVAKKKGLTILTGSQLNDDGKLRESRAIGQDADKVVRIGKVFDKDKVEIDNRRRLDLLKNRGGKRNVQIPMNFYGQYYRFYEAQDEE